MTLDGFVMTSQWEHSWTLCACGREFSWAGMPDSEPVRLAKAEERKHFDACPESLAYAEQQRQAAEKSGLKPWRSDSLAISTETVDTDRVSS